MKTTFKSIMMIIMIVIITVITTSCGNMFGNNDSYTVAYPSDEFVNATNYLGNVNRIIPKNCSRSVNTYEDESYLVEYNSVKPELLDYVEQFELNCRPLATHNIEYLPDKKYVEFTRMWSDMDEDFRHSVRIYQYDPREVVGLMAVGCEFNADFTYDFSHCAEVDFGEPFVSE